MKNKKEEVMKNRNIEVFSYDEFDLQESCILQEYDEYKIKFKKPLTFKKWVEKHEDNILKYDYQDYFDAWFEDNKQTFQELFGFEEEIIYGIDSEKELKETMMDYDCYEDFLHEWPLINNFSQLMEEYVRNNNGTYEFKIRLEYDYNLKQFSMKSVIYNGSFMTPDKVLTITKDRLYEIWEQVKESCEE